MLKEKLICVVTPQGRCYFRAQVVAKEFVDKDNNVIHTVGALPDGEIDELKVSTKTVKHYKGGKLNGSLQIIDLNTGEVTYSEEYKNGVLVDLKDHMAKGVSVATVATAKPTYEGTTMKIKNGTLSFYVQGKEVAEQTLSVNGSPVEQLGEIPDGPVKEFDENNVVRAEAQYQDNKLQGDFIRYNEQGKIISRETYQQGILQGPAFYYAYEAHGVCMTEANYQNALLQGKWTLYSAKDRPFLQATYEQGKLQGLRTNFYESGAVRCEENFEKGKLQGPRKIYFPNGKIWYEENYKNGRLDGDRFCFFPSGQKYLEEFYSDGLLDGPRRIYAENGSVLTNEEYHWGTLIHNTEQRPLK